MEQFIIIFVFKKKHVKLNYTNANENPNLFIFGNDNLDQFYFKPQLYIIIVLINHHIEYDSIHILLIIDKYTV